MWVKSKIRARVENPFNADEICVDSLDAEWFRGKVYFFYPVSSRIAICEQRATLLFCIYKWWISFSLWLWLSHNFSSSFDLQQASGPRWLADFFWFSRNFRSIPKLPILLTSARLLIEGDEEELEQKLLIQLFCNITLIQTELWTTIATPTVIYIIRLATGAGEKIVVKIIIIDIRRSVASIESRQKSGDAGMRIWLRCFGFFLWTFFAPTSLISESES